MSSYREQSLEAKAVRLGIVDARPVGGKKRMGRKTVVVEVRYPSFKGSILSNWHKFRAYDNRELADQVIANKTRTDTIGAEYRIKP